MRHPTTPTGPPGITTETGLYLIKRAICISALATGGHRIRHRIARLPNGKIHRIYPDGSIPADNPFIRGEGLPTLYTLGNRNPRGSPFIPLPMSFGRPNTVPWEGMSSISSTRGNNYGWPVITYGSNYDGVPVSDHTRKEGYMQPVLYWKPSIAVCGIEFYQGKAFPRWENKLLVGALKFEEVRLLDIEQGQGHAPGGDLKNYGPGQGHWTRSCWKCVCGGQSARPHHQALFRGGKVRPVIRTLPEIQRGTEVILPWISRIVIAWFAASERWGIDQYHG